MLPFTFINCDDRFRLHFLGERIKGGAKQERDCYRAWDRFLVLRGKVISQSILVEGQLESFIASYFVPQLSCGPTEHFDATRKARENQDDLRKKLIDLLLAREGFSFSAKVEASATIVEAAELKMTKTKFRNMVNPVAELRNCFAHQRVGIDWQTQRVALWAASMRRWGLKLPKETFADRIPDNFSETYKELCVKAVQSIKSLSRALAELRAAAT